MRKPKKMSRVSLQKILMKMVNPHAKPVRLSPKRIESFRRAIMIPVQHWAGALPSDRKVTSGLKVGR